MDLPITILPDEPDERHHAARTFCLKLIKDFYHIDYTPAWHADIDSLITSPSKNWYASMNRGAFWICHDEDGAILATCGIYSMEWKTDTLQRLRTYYGYENNICQLSRAYVRDDFRGRGIGRKLEYCAVEKSIQFDYRHIYLHADASSKRTIEFWDKLKYIRIGSSEEWRIIDFTKKLHPE